jgi:biopolymer transport protein ExbD
VNFRQGLKAKPVFKIALLPWINVIFLLFIFFMLSSSLTQPSAINVKLPKAVTSDVGNSEDLVILVTSENMIYWNDKVTTLEELRGLMGRADSKERPVLIKADRRASLGRIADILDLGRSMGIEHINVATEQQ